MSAVDLSDSSSLAVLIVSGNITAVLFMVVDVVVLVAVVVAVDPSGSNVVLLAKSAGRQSLINEILQIQYDNNTIP